jgi:hypothetical protein
LLCGDLCGKERDEILELIATDESARKALAEMMKCRQVARQAFGYEAVQAKIDASMADLAGSLKAASAKSGPQPKRRARRRVVSLRWPGLFWQVAAVVAIAVAIYLGVTGREETQATSREAAKVAAEKLARKFAEVEMAGYRRAREEITEANAQALARQLVAAELAGYRKVWQEVASTEPNSPWILLKDGDGRFEYLSAVAARPDARPLVVRCLLVSSEGETLEKINLLLPAHRPVRLSLGEMGQIAGLPIRCDVATQQEWVSMDVKIGTDEARAVGVRGRVRTGEKISEVGQFRLGDRDMKMFLQAVSLNTEQG